jgi:hypothetical protein
MKEKQCENCFPLFRKEGQFAELKLYIVNANAFQQFLFYNTFLTISSLSKKEGLQKLF